MSKSTKIIAALGVVAGLGVAALPAFTYAAPASVKGNVNIEAVVPSAIAMTITGNNDGAGGVNVYTPSGVTEIESYGSESGQAIGTLYNPDSLQVSGSSTTILPNSVSSDNTFKSTIKIWTNASGYTITLNDANTDNSLISGSDTIPAVGTDNNNIEAGTAAWGYRVAVASGEQENDWAAVPISTATGASIKANGSAHADGEQTVVEYAVSTAANQATGTYTDTITYTATTNN